MIDGSQLEIIDQVLNIEIFKTKQKENDRRLLVKISLEQTLVISGDEQNRLREEDLQVAAGQ